MILIIYILLAIILSVCILLQGQGGGLGSAFGGSGSFHTKRGVEKALFSLTIFLTIIFTGLSLLILI